MDGSRDLWEALFGSAGERASGSKERTSADATSTAGLSRLSLEGMGPAERRSLVGLFENLGLVAPTVGEPPTTMALVRPLTAADLGLLKVFGFTPRVDASPPAAAEPAAEPVPTPPPTPPDPILDAEWKPSANPEQAAAQRVIDPGPLPLDAPTPASSAPSQELARPAAPPPARPAERSNNSKWTVALAATAAAGAAGALVLAYRAFQRSSAQDGEVSRLQAESQALRGAVESIDRTLKAYPTDDAGVDEAVDQELAALAEQRAAYRQKRGKRG